MAWIHIHGLNVKSMAYTNSCFPCCLQMIMNNLGLYRTQNDQFENEWHLLHQQVNPNGLNGSAPNVTQIQEYLTRFDPRGAGLQWIQDAIPAVNAQAYRDAAAVSQALIIAEAGGGGHAQLLYRTGDNRYVHVYPIPDAGQIATYVVPHNHGVSFNVEIDGNTASLVIRDDHEHVVGGGTLLLVRSP